MAGNEKLPHFTNDAAEESRVAKARQDRGARGGRARMAKETLDILAEGAYTADETRVELEALMQHCVASSVHISEAAWETLPAPTPCLHKAPEQADVEVHCCTTLAAAQRLALDKDHRVGVLNFASARNPGGGFLTGAEAQEESLARSSGIYPCLLKHMEGFYMPSRCRRSGAYTHDLMFSPAVPVFRDEVGHLLPQPYLVDVVTAAAPNLSVMLKNDGAKVAMPEAAAALRERAYRILCTFASSEVTHLVLGAWGCGVFGNDPATVAGVFRELLVDDTSFFRSRFHVVFAVLDPRMAEVFSTVFGRASAASASAEESHLQIQSEAPESRSREERTPGERRGGRQRRWERKAKRWQEQHDW